MTEPLKLMTESQRKERINSSFFQYQPESKGHSPLGIISPVGIHNHRCHTHHFHSGTGNCCPRIRSFVAQVHARKDPGSLSISFISCLITGLLLRNC